ncbi:thioredoxin-dependent thiol peroxidase [Arenimonas oryziterrae]|uniref:thioredoxin-dependent peroxiredoxin n=1 Tax=Arenimonas oryziterrae DSM 21050 = YC6267 TaxID=1121015 RepID=A0A091AZJ7_9GAMM|nr:thioredoxin-dependent thiol peroxidase [Arenimonas oryziterrae]KFN44861.1 hypothetical protein N789_02260 [Arenimonas oryziterrae DSM 21050 = YC6267]
MLNVGDLAPAFHLGTDSGKKFSSAGLKGTRYVLYFYPKDDTPGCTKEACGFRDNLPAFDKLGVPVFGVSADDENRHAKFAKKYGLNFPLLSDPDHVLLDAYGVWVEKSLYGRKYFGILRSTFVVGRDGRIEHVWDKVNTNTHADDVMAYLSGQPAVAAKPAAKKAAAPAKKVAAKKTATKKVALKKAAAKKVVAKKAPAKKAARKPAARKTVAPARKR